MLIPIPTAIAIVSVILRVYIAIVDWVCVLVRYVIISRVLMILCSVWFGFVSLALHYITKRETQKLYKDSIAHERSQPAASSSIASSRGELELAGAFCVN